MYTFDIHKEAYLTMMHENYIMMRLVAKFRMGSHKLEIEKGQKAIHLKLCLADTIHNFK